MPLPYPGYDPNAFGGFDPNTAGVFGRPSGGLFGIGAGTADTPVQPAPAYVNGAGGRRMTPDQLAREHEIAAALMKSDYSPVQSVWQGLGRVADNWLGALRERDAKKADKASAIENDKVLQALMAGGNPADASRTAMAAMTSAYSSPQVQKLAQMQYERYNPKQQAPTEFQRDYGFLMGIDPSAAANFMSLKTNGTSTDFERTMLGAGITRSSPEWRQAMGTKMQNTLDPWVHIVAGGEGYTGPRSLVDQALNGNRTAPPATLPPDFDFGSAR